jgi:hypothetical protein
MKPKFDLTAFEDEWSLRSHRHDVNLRLEDHQLDELQPVLEGKKETPSPSGFDISWDEDGHAFALHFDNVSIEINDEELKELEAIIKNVTG